MTKTYETEWFKRLKNSILGVGAGIVMIGALFKILHWEGANLALMVGMFTEAFIFTLMGILPPEKDYYWEKIYPHLDIAPEHHGLKGSKAGPKGTISQQLDKMLEEAKVESSLIENLGDGLKKLGENVGRINNATDAGSATNEFTKQASEAAGVLAQMKGAFSGAADAATHLASVSVETKEYHAQVQLVSKNLASLNAIYELELQDTSNHLKAMNKFYGGLSEVMGDLNASVEDTKKYRNVVSELNNNLAQLNQVYGGMLSAMNVPRS